MTDTKNQLCNICSSEPACTGLSPLPKKKVNKPSTVRIHVRVTKSDIDNSWFKRGLNVTYYGPVCNAINRSIKKYGKTALADWAGNVYIDGQSYHPVALKELSKLGRSVDGYKWVQTPRRFSFRMKVK
jgi:hypothetical protein